MSTLASTTPAPQPASPAAPSAVVRRSLKERTQALLRVQWALASAMAVGLLIFCLLGYMPAQRRLAALRLQIESKQRELGNSRDKTRDLSVLALQAQQYQSTVEKYDRSFPKQLDLGQFIGDLTALRQQTSVQDWKYRPGAPKRIDTLQEMPIDMQFTGDFVSAASFMHQVERLDRLTRVKKLKLKQRDAAEGVVDVEATVSIYFADGN